MATSSVPRAPEPGGTGSPLTSGRKAVFALACIGAGFLPVLVGYLQVMLSVWPVVWPSRQPFLPSRCWPSVMIGCVPIGRSRWPSSAWPCSS